MDSEGGGGVRVSGMALAGTSKERERQRFKKEAQSTLTKKHYLSTNPKPS